MRLQYYELKQRQSLPLDAKIKLSKARIQQWYEANRGEVYVGFSGGKDSTVMLDIARSIYPDIPAVFVDTGLEYPEIRGFVKGFDNIEVLRPKLPFHVIKDKYGWPVISKVVSMAISRFRNTKRQDQKEYRLWGKKDPKTGKRLTSGIIPKKYHYLINAPFKISEKCCHFMKKEPFQRYQKKTELKPFIGTMASDSMNRRMDYLKYGCNAFEGPQRSTPLAFWLENDVWDYIRKQDIPYSSIYDMGEDRTGCMNCMFGMMKESCPNRFQRMARRPEHQAQYNYFINKLNQKQVLEYLGVAFA